MGEGGAHRLDPCIHLLNLVQLRPVQHLRHKGRLPGDGASISAMSTMEVIMIESDFNPNPEKQFKRIDSVQHTCGTMRALASLDGIVWVQIEIRPTAVESTRHRARRPKGIRDRFQLSRVMYIRVLHEITVRAFLPKPVQRTSCYSLSCMISVHLRH